MSDTKVLLSATSGLRTKTDGVRSKYDPNIGVVDLTNSKDITIDNSGRPGRRMGWNLKEAGEFHSIWCDKGDCFCILEEATYGSLYRVGTDLSVTGIRANLTMDKRMSFCDINGETFYSNGFENGRVVDGVSYNWPTGNYYGVTTTKVYSDAPVGSHIAFFLGRAVIAEGNTLWFSREYAPGMFDKVRMFWPFPYRITMVKPAIISGKPSPGIFVGDEKFTYFLRGTSPLDFKQEIVATVGPHEWSVATEYIEVDDLSFEGESGYAATWSSSEGLMFGFDSGRVRNVTGEKLVYPKTYNKGAILVCGYHVINTMY